jgi:hypothetical protein
MKMRAKLKHDSQPVLRFCRMDPRQLKLCDALQHGAAKTHLCILLALPLHPKTSETSQNLTNEASQLVRTPVAPCSQQALACTQAGHATQPVGGWTAAMQQACQTYAANT